MAVRAKPGWLEDIAKTCSPREMFLWGRMASRRGGLSPAQVETLPRLVVHGSKRPSVPRLAGVPLGRRLFHRHLQ